MVGIVDARLPSPAADEDSKYLGGIADSNCRSAGHVAVRRPAAGPSNLALVSVSTPTGPAYDIPRPGHLKHGYGGEAVGQLA